jgi:carbamoyl-phosphate synthase small subunit
MVQFTRVIPSELTREPPSAKLSLTRSTADDDQEVLTDPSYAGQIVTFTYPELGNTGVNPEDEESIRPQVKGAIAKNICHLADNWRSSQSLPDYLAAHHVIGIYGIDTRSLTRKIRSVGAMNGAISTEILDYHDLLRLVQAAPQYGRVNLVKEVTTKEVYEWTTPTPSAWEFAPIDSDQEPLTVVAIDFGIKRNILRRLASYGCRVIVVPADTPGKIAEYNPDGIFFSNRIGRSGGCHRRDCPIASNFCKEKNPLLASVWVIKF